MQITDLEKKAGVIAREGVKLPKFDTVEELMAHYFENANDFELVDYGARVKFLKDNGYELTRENLYDSTLSVKAPAEPKKKK